MTSAEAYEAGFEAFLNGDDIESNPCKPEMDEWVFWRQGWVDASNSIG